jgi:putative hydrolase of the HAD superfamily
MIKTLLFDFGAIFINLDKKGPVKAFEKLGLTHWPESFETLNQQFEVGAISNIQFLEGLQKKMPDASLEAIQAGWNTILLDFPWYRLEFLEKLKAQNQYRLFLLSNTDAIHIAAFRKKVGEEFYLRFENCFEKIYFSYEIHLRKPNLACYEYVIRNSQLKADEILFIDDKKENTDAAQQLGIKIWNLQENIEDVTSLFKLNLNNSF